MNVILLIVSMALIGLGAVLLSKSMTRNIELEMRLIPGDIDNVLESFNVGKDIKVAGLIGTDYLDKYGYVIDFKRNRIWHNLHYLSFDTAMKLIGIPYIVLWQNNQKYIFIIDSGSSMSHISKKALNTLDFDLDTSKSFNTIAGGGTFKSEGIVNAKFYYK